MPTIAETVERAVRLQMIEWLRAGNIDIPPEVIGVLGPEIKQMLTSAYADALYDVRLRGLAQESERNAGGERRFIYSHSLIDQDALGAETTIVTFGAMDVCNEVSFHYGSVNTASAVWTLQHADDGGDWENVYKFVLDTSNSFADYNFSLPWPGKARARVLADDTAVAWNYDVTFLRVDR